MTNNKKVLAIMQARMSSTRLPEKVLKELGGGTMLGYELKRLEQATMISKIVVATSMNSEDDAIEELCRDAGIDCFRGSLEDVLLRYVECVKKYPEYDVIVRVTGDCPLIDPVIVDQVVALFLSGEFDYASNVPGGKETFPDGMDCEVFSREALMRAGGEAKLLSEHEHVTPYIRNHPEFRQGGISAPGDYSAYRLTVDTPEDLEVVRFVVQHCGANASYIDYIKLLDEYPDIRAKNTVFKRNEGLEKSLQNDKYIN